LESAESGDNHIEEELANSTLFHNSRWPFLVLERSIVYTHLSDDEDIGLVRYRDYGCVRITLLKMGGWNDSRSKNQCTFISIGSAFLAKLTEGSSELVLAAGDTPAHFTTLVLTPPLGQWTSNCSLIITGKINY
jgi:hypothetical protein